MRSIALAGVPLRALVAGYLFASVGCSNGGEGIDTPIPGPDAPVPDAPDPDAPPSDSLSVTLVRSATPAVGITVFVHDAQGAFVRRGTTDADGRVVLAVEPHDMITVIDSGDYFTWADVAPGDALRLDLAGGIGDPSPLGALSVSISNLPQGTNYVAVTAGCSEYGPDATASAATIANGQVATALSIPLQAWCVADDGKIHVMAYAQQTGAIIGVAYAVDLAPPFPGQTLAVALDTWSVPAHDLTYIESDHNGAPFGNYAVWAMRAGRRYIAPTRSGGLPGPTTTIADGFAEAIAYRTSFTYGSGGFGPCQRSFVLGVVPGTTAQLALHVDTDVLPLVQSASIDNSDPQRPSLALTPQPALGAIADGWLIRTRFGNGTTWGVLLPRAMTSVRLPELPADFGGARPGPAAPADQPYAVGVEGSAFADAAAFRATGMNLLFGAQFLQTTPGSTMRGASWFASCF